MASCARLISNILFATPLQFNIDEILERENNRAHAKRVMPNGPRRHKNSEPWEKRFVSSDCNMICIWYQLGPQCMLCSQISNAHSKNDLVAYKKKHGTCKVEKKRNESLYAWMVYQRQKRKKNLLSEDKLRRLEGIGFPWSHYDP